ncbi:transposase [Rhodococcus erythropolis]|uniref:transposase n=1 Tax=Rhodococcus erythropolis TaxID=1833 RepID=UPI002949A63C|nr:transposase [Rhodococcus erythropolis]MDV6278666.1 transposase [Rhodococcus erythropolis]
MISRGNRYPLYVVDTRRSSQIRRFQQLDSAIGRTGRASRFPTAAAYANYNGSAPVQIASADTDRHRLSRYGDRQLNSALYTVAMVQIRMPASAGRAYFDKKIAEGKKPAAARRSLKRHLSDHVWRIMLADERHRRRTDEDQSDRAA